MKTSLLSLAVAALALAPVSALADPIKVVASFSIIGDFAQEVGGDLISLTTLVGPNGDTHVYEPKPADAVAMSKADVILVNGLTFEGFLDRLVEASGTKAPITELTDGITPLTWAAEDHMDHDAEDEDHDDHDHEVEEHHHHGAYDPHAWQSVANAEIYVGNIRDAFCAVDEANCATYRTNAAAYLEDLAKLDAGIKARIAAIPEDKRVIITSHAAFGYFGRDYDMTFLSPQGVSTETEASAAGVVALIEQIRHEHVAAIFTETISDPRVVEQIAEETGITVSGALYTGALSPADGPAPTYIDMMNYNIDAIGSAILGK